MKTVRVAAGIIHENGDSNRVLAVRRGYGEMSGLWEFPGGKVERGEKCPTIETVSKIANGLKVSIPKLLDIDSNTEVEEEDAFHRIKVAMNGLSPEQMVKIAQIVEEITDFTQEPS